MFSIVSFVGGWMVRAAIATIYDLVYAWRMEQARQRHAERVGRIMEHRWVVNLRGIEWDSGKGEYDTSDLPTDMQIHVVAEDDDEAFEIALTEASDSWGSLIDSVASYQVIAKP